MAKRFSSWLPLETTTKRGPPQKRDPLSSALAPIPIGVVCFVWGYALAHSLNALPNVDLIPIGIYEKRVVSLAHRFVLS